MGAAWTDVFKQNSAECGGHVGTQGNTTRTGRRAATQASESLSTRRTRN